MVVVITTSAGVSAVPNSAKGCDKGDKEGHTDLPDKCQEGGIEQDPPDNDGDFNL